jgi:hypothetical protein
MSAAGPLSDPAAEALRTRLIELRATHSHMTVWCGGAVGSLNEWRGARDEETMDSIEEAAQNGYALRVAAEEAGIAPGPSPELLAAAREADAEGPAGHIKLIWRWAELEPPPGCPLPPETWLEIVFWNRDYCAEQSHLRTGGSPTLVNYERAFLIGHTAAFWETCMDEAHWTDPK